MSRPMFRASKLPHTPRPANSAIIPPRRRGRVLRAFLLGTLGLSALPLTACDDEQSAFAPACPHVDVIAEAADLYSYDGRGLDVGDLASHAAMSGLTGACEAGPVGEHKRKTVRTRLSVAMTVARGPAGGNHPVDLPWFVAVVRDGRILDKKVFDDQASFEPNATTATLRTPVRIIDVPASDSIEDTDYHLAVGFQLSRAQLDYNRAHVAPASFTHHR